jgi:hypothetical protein
MSHRRSTLSISKTIVIDSLCAPLGDIEENPGADELTAVRKSGNGRQLHHLGT